MDGHFILITGTINQEEVSILNIYAPNIKAPTYIKEKLLELKTVIKPHTLIVGNFNTSLTNGQVNQTETQQRNKRITRSNESNELNR